MGIHLLIDGYNLLGCSSGLDRLEDKTLEEAREDLIEKLAVYRGLKQAKITLVFDGGKGGYPTRRTERKRGIGIIYSKLGEEADEVIRNLIRDKSHSYVVVSSDNEIMSFAEGNGLTALRSSEFKGKMEMASYMTEKGMEEEDENYTPLINTRKKGNPRKLSKKERKRRADLRKI